MTPSVSQHNVLTALRTWLAAVLPAGTDIITAEINRVPEPKNKNFVVMTPLRRPRLRTNVDTDVDMVMTGSIAATTMNISAVDATTPGQIEVGSRIFGTGVADNTIVTAFQSGATGGVGNYTVTPSQTVSSRTLSAGAQTLEQGTRMDIQLDFHSDDTSAGDMAQTVSTLMRDAYGVQLFEEQDPNYGVAPLYADDPMQTPFTNAEQNYEWRWTLDCALQFNPTVRVPRQYADSATIELEPVLPE